MKKLSIIAMGFVLLMGMSQCKKEKTETSASEGVKVPITLNVNGGNGTRVDVNTSNGVVTFENGDLLYVASNGVFVGTLSYNGTNFSGEITEPSEGQKLQFYFLGNVDPEETLTEGASTECSVVIGDQTEHLPVISYAPSRENYQVGKMDYNATLLNKCALVKFDVITASEEASCIVGMNNKVIVDFSTNEFTFTQEGEGVITLPSGNGEKWVILLPQEAIEAGEEGSAYSEDGDYTGSCGAVPAIYENGYYTSGIAVTVNIIVIPEGAISGKFTINLDGDQVYFSQGNLQYQASSCTWRFAENQWDYVGTQNPYPGFEAGGTVCGSDNFNISQTYSGWIDLFGWGTSGYNHGAIAYQPWNTSKSYSDYYAYGNWQNNLYDQNGQADWGYNAISNGGNVENNGWRTLTLEEWYFVFNGRNTVSGIRWVRGSVNGVGGTILLPDNWTASIYTLNDTNGGNFASNTITSSDWINILEANGAVFLPSAGHRSGTSIFHAGTAGYYWQSRGGDSSYGMLYVVLGDVHNTYSDGRYYGRSVRLVRNAE
jgi:hypothetical protein